MASNNLHRETTITTTPLSAPLSSQEPEIGPRFRYFYIDPFHDAPCYGSLSYVVPVCYGRDKSHEPCIGRKFEYTMDVKEHAVLGDKSRRDEAEEKAVDKPNAAEEKTRDEAESAARERRKGIWANKIRGNR